MTEAHNKRGVISWFVTNPIAANLLLIFVIAAGLYSAENVRRELFPDSEARFISISMTYPAASPKEVEDGITIKIEEAVKNVSGIKKIRAVSSHGVSTIGLEIYQDFNVGDVLDDVKNAVGGISTFPKDAEGLTIKRAQKTELAFQIQLYGELSEQQAKEMAEEIKRELLADTIVKRVDILGARTYEIAIEIPEEQLQKYNLTLGQVAAKIRAESVNLPSGGIRTSTGGIVLRVEGQSYNQQEFENIVLLSTESGSILRVGDIATVKDGFTESGARSYFDNKYSIGIAVSAVSNQDLIEVGEAAKSYVEKKRAQLPDGVYLSDWLDVTHYLDGRLSMMAKNMLYGAVLVFLMLALFMDLKTAFWVMLGVPTAFLGTFILMPMESFDVSLNMASMFGFIMVCGIIVDDAIIIAESVDTQVKKNGFSRESIIEGTGIVAVPVTFGVLTTVIAFAPTLFVEGSRHAQLFSVGFVVCVSLLISLAESKIILPSHMAAGNHGILKFLASNSHESFQKRMNEKLSSWVITRYKPFLLKAMTLRYVTLATFTGMLLVSFALVAGGVVKYVFFPPEPNDYLQVILKMPTGTDEAGTAAVRKKIEEGLYQLDQDYQKEFKTSSFIKHLFSFAPGADGGSFMLELTPAEERELDSFEIIKRWSDEVGEIEGTSVLDFSAAKAAGSNNLSFMLYGSNKEELELATGELSKELRKFEGVSNFNSSQESKREEYIMHLTPKAIALGLTLSDISLQVKEAFYGVEAQRIQRDNDQIKVIVRYPLERRIAVIDLEEMFIHLRDGRSIPIRELVDIEYSFSQSSLTRVDGVMVAFVSARVDDEVTSPAEVSSQVVNKVLPEIFKKYPSVGHRQDGLSEEQKEMEEDMRSYFLMALLGVFILLAIPLRSYFQPLIIMSVIPFGIVGAVWGHLIMGYPISMMSLFGVITLSGVVVNDSLVMVDFINRMLGEGVEVREAVVQAGIQRFRAIILTTLTTFVGVLPMIFETSIQAQGMIPMAITLAAGIVFATAITLVLVPCLYLVLEDIKSLFERTKVPASVNT